MAKRRKATRGRSSHPGVILAHRTLPSGRVAWRARWTDPVTGRVVTQSVDSLGLTNDVARRDWAARKAKALAVERAAVASGDAPSERVTLADAIDRYFDGQGRRLRERTRETYGLTSKRLKAWADGLGIRLVEEISAPRLMGFRDYLATVPRMEAVRGRGTRGAKTTGSVERSPFTVNRELSACKVLLNAFRRFAWSRLTRDEIADALRPLRTPRPRPVVYDAATLTSIFAAIESHDAATFLVTREEHSGHGEPGTTPRYRPLAPLALFVALAGCRIGEALSLTWDDVDLGAHDGTGEVVIRAHKSKTHTERAIRLDVSPSLLRLLAALRLRGEGEHVFGGRTPWTRDSLDTAQRRIVREFKAPAFQWQAFRSTCATVLANAPAIYGAASVFLAAKRCGHSVAVCERHYAGLLTVSASARTVEAAMGLEEVAARVTAGVMRGRMTSRVGA